MNTMGTDRTRELGQWLLVAIVVAVAMCVAKYAMEAVLTLGASTQRGKAELPIVQEARSAEAEVLDIER